MANVGVGIAIKELLSNPKVLMYSSWVSAGAAVVSAALVTPKAIRAYDDTFNRQIDNDKDVNSPGCKTERILEAGKYYIIPGGFLALSYFLGHRSVGRVTTSLQSIATSYLCGDKLHQAYVKHNKEVLGEEKEKEFRTEAYRPSEVPDDSGITHTPYGDTLFKIVWDDTWFTSSSAAVDKGVLTTNDSMLSEHFMSLNELYMNWGLKSKPSGEDVGWWIDKDGLISIDREYVELDDGTVVGLITFGVDPISRYSDRDCK